MATMTSPKAQDAANLIDRLHDAASDHEDSGLAHLLREAAAALTNMRACVQHGCAIRDFGRPCTQEPDDPRSAALREIRSALIARRSGYLDEARGHNKTSLRTDNQLEMIAGRALGETKP